LTRGDFGLRASDDYILQNVASQVVHSDRKGAQIPQELLCGPMGTKFYCAPSDATVVFRFSHVESFPAGRFGESCRE
jgi:hypothetical protein